MELQPPSRSPFPAAGPAARAERGREFPQCNESAPSHPYGGGVAARACGCLSPVPHPRLGTLRARLPSYPTHATTKGARHTTHIRAPRARGNRAAPLGACGGVRTCASLSAGDASATTGLPGKQHLLGGEWASEARAPSTAQHSTAHSTRFGGARTVRALRVFLGRDL